MRRLLHVFQRFDDRADKPGPQEGAEVS